MLPFTNSKLKSIGILRNLVALFQLRAKLLAVHIVCDILYVGATIIEDC